MDGGAGASACPPRPLESRGGRRERLPHVRSALVPGVGRMLNQGHVVRKGTFELFSVSLVISRRSILQGAAVALGAPMINRGRFSLFAQSDAEYSALTVDLVRGSTVID